MRTITDGHSSMTRLGPNQTAFAPPSAHKSACQAPPPPIRAEAHRLGHGTIIPSNLEIQVTAVFVCSHPPLRATP
ncbi:hypothetical protein PGTUg99_004831 [Puccinia graminis f. sp. tritici]|uniref:Uncharacterized protein n=1 Tax=Puccinia graminis f. sp. tritici TaxID=56615 RepID=A0A5B0RGP8_PUCGR|nr:hypothetical protein PGTUg99_004831 [Puccinia graminis f. sp. tritici]